MTPGEFMRSLGQQQNAEQVEAAVLNFGAMLASFYRGLTKQGMPQEHALALTMNLQEEAMYRGMQIQEGL